MSARNLQLNSRPSEEKTPLRSGVVRLNAAFAAYAIGDQDVVLASDYDLLEASVKRLNSELIKEKAIADLEGTVLRSRVADQEKKSDQYRGQAEHLRSGLNLALQKLGELSESKDIDSRDAINDLMVLLESYISAR